MNLAQFSIKRPVLITSVVSLMLLVGMFAFKKLGVDLFPDISIPVVSIQTIYPGASPNDIETLVSKPIEDELGNLAGLKKLSSTNLESVSVIVVEFNLGTDLKNAEQQIRNRLGNLRRKLPTEIEEPYVRQIDPADLPILRVALSSKLPPAELYDLAHETVKPALERIDGVGLLEIVGGRKREIEVKVDREKLQERELSLIQIAARMQNSSKNVPVGKKESTSIETVYRSVGEFTDLNSIRKVVVNFLGSDRPVRLDEVAVVSDGLEEEKTRSTLNGESALFLDVFRQSGSNTVAVADAVQKALGKVNNDLKLKGIDGKLTLVRNGADRIRANIDDVKESIIIGIVLCVVVVFLFLGSFRSTIVTSLALPNSILGAFVLMYAMGFTINIMTLLALSLAVGLLIDDAIVVRENIFRRMELGESPAVAAEKGTNEVAQAVVATTLVVMAVFGPIAFLSGIVGQFFRQFGLTMVFAMAISLFDAMTVAPMLSAYWADSSHEEHGKKKGLIAGLLRAFDNFQNWLERIYSVGLDFSIRKPITVIALGLGAFVLSLGLTKGIPKTFLPPQDSGEFEVKLEMPPGTSLEATAERTAAVDAFLRKDSNVALTAAAIGTRQEEVNKSSIYVSLKSRKDRKLKTTQVKELFRATLNKDFAGKNLSILIQDYDAFGGGERPFNLNLNGENLDELSAYSSKLLARMKQIKGFVDADTNYRAGKPEFQVVFDREKSEQLGVSPGTAGGELRARIEGVVPATFRSHGVEYDVRLQLDDKYHDLKQEFAVIQVPNINFNMIRLNKISEGREVSGYSQINRQNRSRFVQINGDIGSNGALGEIMSETQRIIEKELPPPPGITWAFVGQAENFKELIENMILAVFFGVTFIYLVLASLYESFVIPLTILLALPLAICGALVALFVTQASINIFSMIGMIMLLGVVTKNSILLVDYALKLQEEGMSRNEALRKACITRLRPILMTSIALIAGMIPIAIGLNEASSQRTAMGIALIGGLISSTFLTLLVVPAAYGYIDDFRAWSLRLVHKNIMGKAGRKE